MHAMLVRIVALVLLLGLGIRAQEKPKLAWYSVMCPVAVVTEPKGRQQIVAIPRGKTHGLLKGRRGRVHAIRKKSKKTAEFLGYAQVEEANDKAARVRVTLIDPKNACRKGDLIELDCLLEKRERGIFWELAKRHIQLRGDLVDHRYYDFDSLVETPARTDALLDSMVARIRESGLSFADMEGLKTVLPSGRYKGRKVSDLMTGATRQELMDFLGFVLSYPGKYLGKVWRVDEIFATWLINAAPYSKMELADAVVAAKTDDDRQELLAVAPELRAEVLAELMRRSRALAGKRRLDEARASLGIADRVRRSSDDPAAALESSFTDGVVKKYERDGRDAVKQFRATLAACDKAKPLPEPAQWIESRSYFQLGGLLKKQGKFKAALAAYRNCARVEEEIGDDLESRSDTTRLTADLLRDQGELKQAIAEYKKAIEQFRELDSRDRLNEALAGRASALGKLGRTNDAILGYSALMREHANAGNEAKVANTLADIANQYWEQGAMPHATAVFQEALAIRERRGDVVGVADVQESLALLHAGAGNYAEAKRLNGLVQEVYASKYRRSSTLIAAADGGWFDAGLGDYEGGLQTMENALDKLKEQEFPYGVMFVRNRIAMVRAQHHEYEAARALYAVSVEAARASGARDSLASSLSSRASICITLRDFDAGRTNLDEAIAIRHATGALGSEVKARLLLAHLERMRGRSG